MNDHMRLIMSQQYYHGANWDCCFLRPGADYLISLKTWFVYVYFLI